MFDKIIFLDIDGVLVPQKRQHDTQAEWYGNKAYPFDRDCVNLLNEILEQTSAEIVLTSNWQFEFTDTEMIEKIFRFNGVAKTPIDYSGGYGNDKPSDIANFINENEIETFVILDDLDLSELGDNFVQIDPMYGLTENDADTAVKLLNPI